MEYRNTLIGPRWARSDILIRDVAYTEGVEARVERETTFFSEHVRFALVGNPAAIQRVLDGMNKAIDEYNGEHP